jgi:hypothetical protein
VWTPNPNTQNEASNVLHGTKEKKMRKFMLLYKGPATDPMAMSAEERSEVMGEWNAWYAKYGEAISDAGSPFKPGESIKDNGTDVRSTKLSGYTIVEAASMRSAKAMAKRHPFLSDGRGKFAIEIFELMPMPRA